MGNAQGVAIPIFWDIASNSGIIVSIAFLTAVAWLMTHRRRVNPTLPFAEFASGHRSDFFQVFSRSVVILISLVIASSYVFGSEVLMKTIFNKMPTPYLVYIFLFMAYDAFWKVVGQFNGELH
jgi:magnesium-transporting ATPase (P-type)